MARYELLAFTYKPDAREQNYEIVHIDGTPLSHLYDIDRFTTQFSDKYALLFHLKEKKAIGEACNALVIRHNHVKKDRQGPPFYTVVYDSPILNACTVGIQSKKIKEKTEQGYTYKYCAMIDTSLEVYQKFSTEIERVYQEKIKKVSYEEEAILQCAHNEVMYHLPRYKYFRGYILNSKERSKNISNPVTEEIKKPVRNHYSFYVAPEAYEPIEDDTMYLTEEEKNFMVNYEKEAEYHCRR